MGVEIQSEKIRTLILNLAQELRTTFGKMPNKVVVTSEISLKLMMDQLLKDTEMPRMELQNSVNKLMLLRRKVIKKKKDYREAKRVLKAAVKLEKKIHLEVNTADSLVSLTFETQLGMLKTVVSNTRDGVRDHN